MPKLIIFRDRDPWYRPDASGYNKIGYVTKADKVVYALRTRITIAPLAKIKYKRNTMLAIPNVTSEENVEAYFTQNQPHVGLFYRGIAAFKAGDLSLFDQPIRLPILRSLQPGEFERKWHEFAAALRPGDGIMTFDTESILSRFIAAIDHGTWSHTCTYVGDGRICEAIGSGVTERSLGCYRTPRYRIGVYRPNITKEQAETMIALLRSQVGKPYAYGKVVRLGIKKLIAPRSTIATPRDMSPNDLAALAPMDLIASI